MTDQELMKRLRERDLGYGETAADRIGDLLKFSNYWHNRAETAEADCERIISEWAEVSQKNYQRAKSAEAKLAKAVERLRNIRELNMTAEDENGHRWANSDLIEQEIVAVLAELEGK